MAFFPRSEIEELIQEVQGEEENPWTIWSGASEDTAVQLLNKDGSNPYICKTSVPTEVLATGASFEVQTEFFRVTLVNTTVKPDSSTGYFLSLDNGVTKDRVRFIFRRNSVQNTYWSIVVANG